MPCQHCTCEHCKETVHASDCAVHDGPALPIGECSCLNQTRLDAALAGPRHTLPEGASTPEEIQAALDALAHPKIPRDEWISRYAQRISEQAGWPTDAALDAATVAYECEREATPSTPEEDADEEMHHWEGDDNDGMQ